MAIQHAQPGLHLHQRAVENGILAMVVVVIVAITGVWLSGAMAPSTSVPVAYPAIERGLTQDREGDNSVFVPSAEKGQIQAREGDH